MMNSSARVLVLGFLCLAFSDGEKAGVTELAARCGSEIRWVQDLDAAKVRAKKEGRLILWYISKVVQSTGHHGPMYKAHVLDRYMQEGPFMDEDLIQLIGRKFIPFTLPHQDALSAVPELAKELNLVRSEFIEPGFVFMTSDGKVVHKIDKIRTMSGEFLVHVLRSVLEKNPSYHAGSGKRETADEYILDGDYALAEKVLGEDEKAQTLALKAALYRRWRKWDQALECVKKAEGLTKDEKILGDVLVEEALILQRSGKFSEAEKVYDKVVKDHSGSSRHAEAQYRLGAIHYLSARDDQAKSTWQQIIEEHPDARWAWKAAAELTGIGPTGHGPFVHGFEPLAAAPETAWADLPPDTAYHRTEKDVDAIVQDALDLLLRYQRPDGMWKDSQYDFMGKQNIPNTWMAMTAIAANALTAWKDRDPRIPRALEKAEAALLDSTRLADSKIERSYAQAYRLAYFTHRARESGESDRKKYMKIMASIIDALQKEQLSNGAWMHEYSNPFVTTTVLLALYEARQAGAEVSKETLDKGLAALKKSRGKDGTFAYDRGSGANINQAAGRMPQCEMALYLYGESTMADLEKAVEAFFTYRRNLELVRLYDYHADVFGNGGFFFLYDYYGATEAIRLLKPEAQKKYFTQLRTFMAGVQECDGSFIDDHELGKSYGTSMALLILKNCASQ